MTGKQILGGLVGAVLLGAAAWGFTRLGLSRDQQVDFLGAAFGSFAAVATALGVVEFQARRETARVRTAVDHLLWEAHTLAQHYLEAAPAEIEFKESLLLAFSNSMDTATAVARDHQHRAIGMARASHALRTMSLVVDQLGDNDRTPEMLAALQDSITDCRLMLVTTSQPAAS